MPRRSHFWIKNGPGEDDNEDSLDERQGGECYWCGCKMIDPSIIYLKKQPNNLATLEHLDSRLSGQRGKRSGVRRVVACRLCNNKRGAREETQLPINELWRRSRHVRD